MILQQKPIDKAVFCGDIHYGIRNNSSSWLNNINNIFFNHFLIPYLLSLPDIERYQIFFTGDIYDNKQMLSVQTLNAVHFTFTKLASILPVHVNLGNHDLFGHSSVMVDGKEEWINSCRHLYDIDGVQVYDKPTTLETIAGRKFTVIPYVGTPNKHDLSKEIGIVENVDHDDYLFMHTTVEGFFYDGKPIVEGEGITKKLLSRFKKVYNGHIHGMQEDGNILILGTPYHTRVSESDNPCYIYNADFSAPDEITTRIENILSPKYRIANILRLSNMTVGAAIKFVTNNYVKIRVPSHLTSLYDYNRITEILSPYALSIEFDPLASDTSEKEAVVGDDGIDMTKTGKVDIKSKYPEFLDGISLVNLSSKESAEVTDEMKVHLADDFAKLFAMAETKIGVNDMET